PASAPDAQYYRPGEKTDAGPPQPRHIGAHAVAKETQPGQGEAELELRESAHHASATLPPPSRRLSAARKSSVARASTSVTIPAAMPSSNDSASSLYKSHFVSASDVADDPERPASTASTSASKLAAGRTRLTRPIAPASSALITRPLSTRSAARFSPSVRRSIVMTMAGTKPILTSGNPNSASWSDRKSTRLNSS